ncbi:hypothetical protein [Brevibacillus reuszeri]|uniref:hypothetical protein n=1 Tax=Brevibacillus reuszeri TaxID=54915 RepID=UPI0013E0A96B|nr:hypothetical protein [Brevibacillus reuszeri]
MKSVLERILNSFLLAYVVGGLATAFVTWMITPITLEEFAVCVFVWPIVLIAILYAVPLM